MSKTDDPLENWKVVNKHTQELSSHVSENENTTKNKQGLSCWHITKAMKSLRPTCVHKP